MFRIGRPHHGSRRPWVATLAIAAAASTAGAVLGLRAQAPAPPAASPARTAFEHALPALDGTKLKVHLIQVTYGPGEASKPHSHPCPVIGHIVEGAVRMKIGDTPERVYKAGESFYEAPNSHHLVSGNASTSERARLLAYFTCDKDTPLSVPIAHE
jgi:quercetin dioxygenase-like cupin family protein